MQVQAFDAYTDIVVIGQDDEAADYDNPHGHIHGFAAYVRAVSPRGDTRVLHVQTGPEESVVLARAEVIAEALNIRLTHLGRLPVGFDRWTEGRAVYGSDAYVEYGAADDLAWEARAAEEESWA